MEKALRMRGEGFRGFLKMANKKEHWAMPEWMQPYKNYIRNTGGNDVTELMNGNTDPMINLPLSTLQACVKSQVGLLYELYERGLLK